MAIKRISRKDMAGMTSMEVFRSSAEPYRKLSAYLKPYWFRFSLGILFGGLFGACNGLLVLTIKYVTSVVFPGQEASLQTAMANGAGSGLAIGQVAWACATVPAIMMLRGLLSYLNAYCMLWVSNKVLNDIRMHLFKRLMLQSMDFFNHQKTGDLIQTVFNQTRMAQSALTTITGDAIKQPISILSALAVLFYIDWRFTLVSLVLFPICIIPVMVVGKKVRKSGGREEDEAGMLMVVMHEASAGIRLVKSHAREAYEEEKFQRSNHSMLQFMMRWQKAMELVGPMVETVASIGISLALLYAWWRGLGAASFMALQGGLIMLYPPFKTLSRIHILMQKCIAATTKVFELIEREPDIKDAPDAVRLESCRGEIELRNVGFSYNQGVPALEGVNLKFEAGKYYALVGASGAGKSTVLSLLLRFYDPQTGEIFMDGHDIRNLIQTTLRDNIGLVSQDTFLFHDSIYNNIRYGRLDATKEEIEEAARRAFAHDFILAQSKGYDTVIGDKGCMLSGGQQQRLSIARAILRNAPVLLLDEATSALDSESERHIQAALDDLSRGKTVVAIAHRLSTILQADEIIVMHQGKVVERGSHAQLMEKSVYYRRLYDMQFGGRDGDGIEDGFVTEPTLTV